VLSDEEKQKAIEDRNIQKGKFARILVRQRELKVLQDHGSVSEDQEHRHIGRLRKEGLQRRQGSRCTE